MNRVREACRGASEAFRVPIEDEQSRPEPDREEDEVQEENAETSLDQPSEG